MKKNDKDTTKRTSVAATSNPTAAYEIDDSVS
jgi:hypothetical protein